MTDVEAEKIVRQIAKRLRTRREQLGLSMNEVAARAGLNQVAVSRIEKGERSPQVHTLLKLSDALGLKWNEIV